MSLEVKHRRGTAAEHATFTGAEGELTYDTTNKRLVAHDGSTAGGIPVAKAAEIGTVVDGIPVDMTDIADGYILYYDAATETIKSKQDSGEGGGMTPTADIFPGFSAYAYNRSVSEIPVA